MAERSTTMTAIFTPGYAAAEQFTSVKLGPWTDIYGLAATLYHAITGQIPPSAVERVLKDTYQPLSRAATARLSRRRCSPASMPGLAIRVDDRPQSIAEWRQMLRSGTGRRPRRRPSHAKPGRWPAPEPQPAGPHHPQGPGAVGRGERRRSSCWPARATSPGRPTRRAPSARRRSACRPNSSSRRSPSGARPTRWRRRSAGSRTRRGPGPTAEAEAKRQAEAELEEARQARQKAERRADQLKADIEAQRRADAAAGADGTAQRRAAEEAAQRKAEAEAAALRQAEEEAQKKAAAEAEAKRLADEALAKAEAEQQRADAEARAKAEAEGRRSVRPTTRHGRRRSAAEAEGDEAKSKKAAEAAEKALRLETRTASACRSR